MQFGHFQIKPEPTMVFRDKLDKVNVWVMRVILLLTFVFANFYNTNTIYAETMGVTPLAQTLPTWVTWAFSHITSAGISVVVLELIGNFYYGFIKPICPPVNLTRKGFMVYIRASYVIRNLICGAINLIFLLGDVYFYAFSGVISVVVTVLTLTATYLYVNKHYVPKEAKSAFLKLVAIPFFVVQFVTVLMELL